MHFRRFLWTTGRTAVRGFEHVNMPRASRAPELLDLLADLGGVATYATLVQATSVGVLRCAVRAGHVVRLGHDTYVLPQLARPGDGGAHSGPRAWSDTGTEPTATAMLDLARARAVARANGVVLSHRSAAAQYDWACFDDGGLDVIRGHRRRPRRGVPLHLREFARSPTTEELAAHVTEPMRTVVHCAADLPYAEALGVADSALRAGRIGPHELVRAAERCTGTGARNVRRVAAHADGRAANPFESGLRAISHGVPGIRCEPQVEISGDGFYARVDLADRARRIVIEADSYTFHGGPAEFARDCRRYDELIARDWLVLRFTYSDVRNRPDWVAATIAATVRQRPKYTHDDMH